MKKITSILCLIRKCTFIAIIALPFLFQNSFAFGPPPPPGGGVDPDDPRDPPPRVPIDGGIGILLAAGLFYGAKKLHDVNKKK